MICLVFLVDFGLRMNRASSPRVYRGQYAAFVDLVLAMTVISVASVLVLQTESRAAGATTTPAVMRSGGRS